MTVDFTYREEKPKWAVRWSHGWIRDSPESWCEQGFLRIWVTGDQERLGSPVMFLPQLAAVSQLGDFIRWLQFSCSVGCVFSGSRHHQSALCVFCLVWNLGVWVFEISFFWLVSIYFVSSPRSLTPASPFGSSVFLFICHFDRISGWLWVLFPTAAFFFWHQGAITLRPFCDLCTATVSFPTCTPQTLYCDLLLCQNHCSRVHYWLFFWWKFMLNYFFFLTIINRKWRNNISDVMSLYCFTEIQLAVVKW